MSASSSRTSRRIDSSRRPIGSRPLSTGTIAVADERTFSCFSVGSIAGTYEEIYVPRIFVPWARLLLDRAALRPGEGVLDIATGPGTVARIAAEQVGPQGRVVGADFSEAMIAIAKGKPGVTSAAPVEYIVSPAAPLTVEDETFDVVTCQQGLQFFPDRAAASSRRYGARSRSSQASRHWRRRCASRCRPTRRSLTGPRF